MNEIIPSQIDIIILKIESLFHLLAMYRPVDYPNFMSKTSR
jgi:hypothetical protein